MPCLDINNCEDVITELVAAYQDMSPAQRVAMTQLLQIVELSGELICDCPKDHGQLLG